MHESAKDDTLIAIRYKT